MHYVRKNSLFDDTHRYFDGSGASMNKDTGVIKIPSYMVEEAISSAPSHIVMAGRDLKKDFLVEGRRIGFVNFGQAVRIIDPITREYRESLKSDLAKIMRLTDALDDLDLSYRAVASRDVLEKVEPLHNAEAIFSNTSKHFLSVQMLRM
jgi:trimethylamine--corrinoid protein Co-methyltransferase